MYIKDLVGGELMLASASRTGINGNALSSVPSSSADGSRVGFNSASTNLDPTDTDPAFDIYVKERPPNDRSISVVDTSAIEGTAGSAAQAVFAVSLSSASGQPVTVGFATADRTARVSADYTATVGTLTFAPGETSKAVTVPVAGDALDEADETFALNLSNPSNANIADGSGTGTITDDDLPPTLSIADARMTEGASGTRPAAFAVRLSRASGKTVTVRYATANGLAKAPSDYTAKSGTLTFTSGQTVKTVAVAVRGDRLSERSETFFVKLSMVTDATIADGTGRGTIGNDD